MEPRRPLSALVPHAPRLVPGVALPATRFVPGRQPHPRRDPRGSLYGAPPPAPGLPAERWREDRSYLLGIDLYHQGYLWESHEAFEACWFASREARHRELLNALIQLAAAELQLHRGVARGVRRLAGRVADRTGRLADSLAPRRRLAGLDVPRLHAAASRRFAGALDPQGIPLATGSDPVELRVDPTGEPT